MLLTHLLQLFSNCDDLLLVIWLHSTSRATTMSVVISIRRRQPILHISRPSIDHIAGVRGIISRYVTTMSTPSATYHVYEMDVTSLEDQWLEAHERRREWVDYSTALTRLKWKPELAQALSLSSLAPTGR